MKNPSTLIGFATIAVFAIVNFAVAATTISTDIATDGSLSVNSTTATSTFSTGGLTVGTSQFVVQQTSGKVGIGTTSPADTLTVSNPSGVGTMSLWGSSNMRFDMRNGDGNKFSLQFTGGTTNLNLQYNGGTKDIFSSTGQMYLGGNFGATNMLDVNGAVSIGNTYAAAGVTAPKNGAIIVGNVGIGTSTPATKLQVSSGASATTTVTVGELGLTSSKGCVNMNRVDGGAGSFYISAAGALVAETNYCK